MKLLSWAWKAIKFGVGLGLGVALIAVGAGFWWANEAYNQLPGLDALTDYRPKMPMRVYTSDMALIGEFGEERRTVVAIKEMPKKMVLALLAAEDDRFYEHKGVDFQGIARAAINNWRGGPKQGASTITQQLARNFYLSKEQSFKRKAYEALLAWKIERELGKDQILEIYMNQIFLGQRAYGFGSAAQIYFGKSIDKLSVAQYAMLAGLPKAPTAYNPVVNPKRARVRQEYILGRMAKLGYIGEAERQAAMVEPLKLTTRVDGVVASQGAEHVAEMARAFAIEKFGEEAYSMGLSVVTTVGKEDQEVAVASVRKAVVAYDRVRGYRGPEGFAQLPGEKESDAEVAKAVAKALADKREAGLMWPAAVLEAGPKKIVAMMPGAGEVELSGSDALGFAAANLSAQATKEKRIVRGSIIRLEREDGKWRVAQIPEVASAFVATDAKTGAIKALVGGFDFGLGKFNRAAQALRQPGSSFKPFVYSAALEKGLSPSTVINDAPFFYDPGQGGAVWAPKNYDGKNAGPMSMRSALTASKNMVTARIISEIGPLYAQQYATRFGFDPAKNPPVLALGLGAGSVTPLQMAAAYSVFANGGYKVDAHIVAKVLDVSGKPLYLAKPAKAGDESRRVIEEANAFVMDTMLKDVAQKGTAAKASATLKRQDLAGKTGTTNDSMDAWFAGYHPDIVAVAWMGFDQPKSLGSRETGGGLALPIWIDFMAHALKNKPQGPKREAPEGVEFVGGDYFLSQYPPGVAKASLGLEEIPVEPEVKDVGVEAAEPAMEKNTIKLLSPSGLMPMLPKGSSN